MRLVLEYKNIKKDNLNLLKNAESLISELGIDIEKKYNENTESRYWLFSPNDENINMYFMVSDEDLEKNDTSEVFRDIFNKIEEIQNQNEHIINMFESKDGNVDIEQLRNEISDINDEIELTKLLTDNNEYVYNNINEGSYEEDDSEDDEEFLEDDIREEIERRNELLEQIKSLKDCDNSYKINDVLEAILDYIDDEEITEATRDSIN